MNSRFYHLILQRTQHSLFANWAWWSRTAAKYFGVREQTQSRCELRREGGRRRARAEMATWPRRRCPFRRSEVLSSLYSLGRYLITFQGMCHRNRMSSTACIASVHLTAISRLFGINCFDEMTGCTALFNPFTHFQIAKHKCHDIWNLT